jgi:hypothetical protein
MGKYTREAVAAILGNEELTPKQKEDKLFALYGQALSEGYISVTEAQTATQNAVKAAQEEWEKNKPKVNVLETPEYKELQGQFDGYKTRQEARNSADYAGIKPKFFDRVYDLLDHSDGAKPVTEQLAELKKDYEEYFNPADPAPKMPQFGAKPEGAMPKGEEGAVAAFTSAWGFPKK